MNDLPLLELHSVTKFFCRDARLAQRYGVADIARAVIGPGQQRTAPRRGEFASVDGVSLTLGRGEGLAIMGQNGAGKTTLLRLIAGFIEPDAGEVVVRGRVNTVTELGQGLNPQLSGRENAELGLACRGIPRSDVPALISAIAEFAELGDAIDSPVGTYSTGMRMRLSFGIAVHVPCDLLLIDEVLAVGDIRFQNKCMAVIYRHLEQGGALILISHHIPQILAICERGAVIDRGRMVIDDGVNVAADHFLSLLKEIRTVEQPNEEPSGDAVVGDVRVRSSDGGPLLPGGTIDIEIEYTVNKLVDVQCVVMVWTGDLSTYITGAVDAVYSPATKGERVVRRCTIPSAPFTPGTYAVRCSVQDATTSYPLTTFGFRQQPVFFAIEGTTERRDVLIKNGGQLVTVEYQWGSPRGSDAPA